MVAAARDLLGTRFQHQGRLPGLALDCVGMLIAVAKSLGYPYVDVRGYGRSPDGHLIVQALDQCCVREQGPAVGRIVGFEYYKDLPQHVGIIGDWHLGGFSLLHTYADAGKVSEHPLELDMAKVIGYWSWRS